MLKVINKKDKFLLIHILYVFSKSSVDKMSNEYFCISKEMVSFAP